ncbi:lasso peptide isopeptide bond-forming cyclase [Asticcacaulis benevestitus]|uniref:asparagine synthase (glutamine-hydrolyzing) n=1 Tax=Asticcacaulis benevestitus DSM 16100 = ATCC BAA-896 TaxID=1121022 RepID=V4PW62_9CAUL|nr:lasso peptide isopeptide bond-forming cyclase [Asticcacaulis benevestitus]ESQ92586.1 hypothetical protein ABENE_08080 [Asticcacaulis benevestitus DSM 16100 = ATCC BAA-896]
MAERYLCLIARTEEAQSTPARKIAASADFSASFEAEGISIFTRDAVPIILADDGGMIVGDVFSSSQLHARQHRVADDVASAARASMGASLTRAIWGRYIGFIIGADGSFNVVRDPSGGMPCHYVERNGWVAIASDVMVLFDIGFVAGDINWTFMRRHLLAHEFRTPETGLPGVLELSSGFRLSITRHGLSVASVWSPWDFASSPLEDGIEELIPELYATVRDCTRALASRFQNILLGVSGGLDSSIVAACLAHPASHLSCLTMATDEPEGDERQYARILTEALDVPLLERFHQISDIDITRSTASHLPRPILFAFGQSEHKLRKRLSQTLGIDAHFSGVGGDNVFCFMKSATPLLDRFLSEGLSSGLVETLNDICQMRSCSAIEVLTMATKRAFSHDGAYAVFADTRLLNPEITKLSEPVSHPWLQAPPDTLPGRAVHVSFLARIQGTIDGYPRDEPALILPLLSQPVMELCLRIPSWKWCAGGRDRALARRAFTPDLPSAIIDRRSKGGPHSFAYDVVDTNKTILKTQLLDGLLVGQGLLDRHRLEQILSSPSPIPPGLYMRLAVLAEAEAWSQHWSNKLRQRAAEPA